MLSVGHLDVRQLAAAAFHEIVQTEVGARRVVNRHQVVGPPVDDQGWPAAQIALHLDLLDPFFHSLVIE